MGFIIILGLIIGTEFAYRDPLFKLTLRWVPHLQSSLSNASINFFWFMTFLGYGNAPVAVFVLYYVFSTRDKAFFLLFVHTCEGYVN